jgi:putative glycosyltransferase (TIGR04348 family)
MNYLKHTSFLSTKNTKSTKKIKRRELFGQFSKLFSLSFVRSCLSFFSWKTLFFSCDCPDLHKASMISSLHFSYACTLVEILISHDPMKPPRILIVCPALASANNGNWQTAWRWSQMLSPMFEVSIAQEWNGEPFDAMLAMHARRSADSIARWAQSMNASAEARGLAVVLTGTDLYRDIQTDASAQASLAFAQSLLVLQECAPTALPLPIRHKARVIFQSTQTREPALKTPKHLRAVMVGHLRDEKSPQTLYAAARLLQDHADIFIDHIGDALDANLGTQAQACAAQYPNYRWLGGLPHTTTLRHIQRAHVLVHTSRMEGGAHVVLEAVCSGTPVIASKIDGNVGMLGTDYAGYFTFDDAQGLAELLLRCRASQTQANGFYAQLLAQCAQRAPLFAPAAEQATLIKFVNELIQDVESNPLQSNSRKEDTTPDAST